jgi:hypothetical protein
MVEEERRLVQCDPGFGRVARQVCQKDLLSCAIGLVISGHSSFERESMSVEDASKRSLGYAEIERLGNKGNAIAQTTGVLIQEELDKPLLLQARELSCVISIERSSGG